MNAYMNYMEWKGLFCRWASWGMGRPHGLDQVRNIEVEQVGMVAACLAKTASYRGGPR